MVELEFSEVATCFETLLDSLLRRHRTELSGKLYLRILKHIDPEDKAIGILLQAFHQCLSALLTNFGSSSEVLLEESLETIFHALDTPVFHFSVKEALHSVRL